MSTATTIGVSALRLPAPMPRFVADPGGIADFGQDVLSASAIFDDTGTFAAGTARCPSWWGDAGDVYHAQIRALGRRADALSLASRNVGGRVLDHADQIAALQRRHDDLEHRFGRLIGQLADQVSDALAGAPRGDRAAWRDGPQDDGTLARLVGTYEDDRARWISDLRSAEEAMVRTFDRAMTEADVERRYGGVPDPVDRVSVPPPGTAPQDVRAWWQHLTRAQRLALIAASPALLGNLDGLPAAVRDLANRTRLGRDLAELRAIPTSRRTATEQDRLDNARATQKALDQMRITDPLTGDPVPVQLYVYDPDSFDRDGRVAISVGDLDTAHDVGITVPGFGTDMQSAPDQAPKAINLYQATRFLNLHDTVATMFWIGYDAPDAADGTGDGDGVGVGAKVITDGLARAGGDRLRDLVDGVVAMRPDDPHLTVIGHSYGSTTAADGASVTDPGKIDDLILVGSPGAGAGHDHAADLGTQVWVGRNSADPITDLGEDGWWGLGHPDPAGALPTLGLGTDPASDDFGGIRFAAEDPGRDAGGVAGLLADHTSYFDHNTEALANMAHIVGGDDDEVQQVPGVHDPVLPDPARAPGGILGVGKGLFDAGASPLDGRGPDGLADGLRETQQGLDALVGGPHDPESQRQPTSPYTH